MNKIKLSTKLICLIVVSTLVMAAIGLVGIYELQMIGNSAKVLYEDSVLGLSALGDTKSLLEDKSRTTMMLLMSKDANQIEALKKLLDTMNDTINESLDALDKALNGVVQKENIKQIRQSVDEFNTYITTLFADAEDGVDASTHVNQLVIKQNAILNIIVNLEKYQKNISLTMYDTSQQSYNESRQLFMIILAISTIFILVLGFLIYRSTIKPLNELSKTAKKLEEGDLRTDSKYKGNNTEIGRVMSAFGAAILNLRQLLTQINETAEGVSAASETLNTTAQETGNGAAQVAITIEQLAATSQEQITKTNIIKVAIENMNNAVEKIVESYEKAQTDTDRAHFLAEQGLQQLDSSIAQMETITDVTYDMGNKVKGLGELSQSISEIVNIISSIAGQTNLLALNAAIEAARAGEHGRGFAVVAEEVRKLAEQSDQSAHEITELIMKIQQMVETAMQSMEKGANEVKAGTEIIEASGTSFREISNAVNNVKMAMGDVGIATEEINNESKTVEETISAALISYETIAANTQEVSATTQEQTAAIEEVVASISKLSSMAEELKNAILRFKI